MCEPTVKWVPIPRVMGGHLYVELDLSVFATISDCTGTDPLSNGIPTMQTDWGLPDADVPLLRHRRETRGTGDHHQYWIAEVHASADDEPLENFG